MGTEATRAVELTEEEMERKSMAVIRMFTKAFTKAASEEAEGGGNGTGKEERSVS